MSTDKENSSPNKKARKSLAVNWAPQSLCQKLTESSLARPETPSKSLLGAENSLVFTPPSILKDTLSTGSNSAERGIMKNENDAVSPPQEEIGEKSAGKSMTGISENSPPKSKARAILEYHVGCRNVLV